MYSIMFAFIVLHIDMLNPLYLIVYAIYSWYMRIHVCVYE